MLRNFWTDIAGGTADIIAAEDRDLCKDGLPGSEEYKGRRYALYSIWRPLKMVKRDPIAVCDGRSIDEERDLIEHVYKGLLLSLSLLFLSFIPPLFRHSQMPAQQTD